MGENRTDIGPPDGSQINIGDSYLTRDWAEHFGVGVERLEEAVRQVGPIVEDVRRWLELH